MTALRRVYNTDRIMEELFDSLWSHNSKRSTVPVDIIEKEEEYLVRMDLPGIKKESVNITMKERVLSVEVNEENKEEEEGRYHIRNRKNLSFKSSWQMPENSDSESLSASMDQGVLTLTLRKKEEAAPRKISIA